MNKDLFNNADPQEVAVGSMKIIDAIQEMDAGAQQASLTAAFMLLSERNGIRPTDAYMVAHNLMHNIDGKRPEFRAVKMYMEKEL